MLTCVDPLGNKVVLNRQVLYGHIYRRHPELKNKAAQIKDAIADPDYIAKSKKDNRSLLYFKRLNSLLFLMVVATPRGKSVFVRTRGDPIIWRKKIST